MSEAKRRPGRRREVQIRVEAFKWARKTAKLTQASLAAKARAIKGDESISEAFIAQIETSRRCPTLVNAEAFAEALGCPLEVIADVLDGDGRIVNKYAAKSDEAAA